MRFHSLLFLVFLAVTAVIAWQLAPRHRKVWLLVTSYLFYASWHLKYVVLLFVVLLFLLEDVPGSFALSPRSILSCLIQL